MDSRYSTGKVCLEECYDLEPGMSYKCKLVYTTQSDMNKGSGETDTSVGRIKVTRF